MISQGMCFVFVASRQQTLDQNIVGAAIVN